MFMGYHYNKTMFYINIKPMEETMKHKTKTSNDKMTLKKLIKVVNQYIEVESKIKDMTSIKKMLRETILDNQNMFPLNDIKNSGVVADVYEQTRNVFNSKLFKEKHLDLYHEFTSPQLVKMIKAELRKQ